MDFQLNEEQLALQEGFRQFCSKQFPVDELRKLSNASGFDRTLWSELADLGFFSLNIADDQNGLGLGSVETVIGLEELGRCLLPGPLVWSQLAAGLVDGVAGGDRIVGGLDFIGASHTPIIVEHLSIIDDLLILRPEGVFLIDPRELTATSIDKPLDHFTPVHHLKNLPEGRKIADADSAQQLWWRGATLAAGQLLGIAEQTLELANAYAKEREQFGKPIGQFQAIKHLLADMYVRQEVARSATYAAAATLDDPEVGHPQRAVSSAKLNAGEAAVTNSRTCIQIHGGMGYTWDIPAHFYLKRSWVLDTVFGTHEEHADLIAESLSEEISDKVG